MDFITSHLFWMHLEQSHLLWMTGIGQLTRGAFRIIDLLWNPYFSRAPGKSENFKYLIYKCSLTLFHSQSQFFNLIFSHAVCLEWRNCTAITDALTAILIHLYYDSPLILPSDVTQLLGIPQLKFPLESKSI